MAETLLENESTVYRRGLLILSLSFKRFHVNSELLRVKAIFKFPTVSRGFHVIQVFKTTQLSHIRGLLDVLFPYLRKGTNKTLRHGMAKKRDKLWNTW